MSVSKWLQKQLTKPKKQSQAWLDLVDAIGQTAEIYTEPFLKRLKGRASLFEHEEIDLDVALSELGKFFALGDIRSEDKAISIMQRQDELHFKRTITPLVNALHREFRGMSVTYQEVYNHADKPYGEDMRTANQIYTDKDRWWLTSRGVVSIDLTTLRNVDFIDMGDLEEKVMRVIDPLIPLHIVVDGILYIAVFQLKERPEHFYTAKQAVYESVDFPQEHHESVDIKPQPIDNETINIKEVNQYDPKTVRVDSMRLDSWSLDRPLFKK